jgi:hypothetical protein
MVLSGETRRGARRLGHTRARLDLGKTCLWREEGRQGA